MGQHKHNPVAIAAQNGELQPKPKSKMTKRETERLLYAKCQEEMAKYLTGAHSEKNKEVIE